MYEHSDKFENCYLGVDVGGSHISAALVHAADGKVLADSFCRKRISSNAADAKKIVDEWLALFKETLAGMPPVTVEGIGIAMPGPFDYRNGISLIDGVDKYHALFGMNIKAAIKTGLGLEVPIVFENDAACFGLGEGLAEHAGKHDNIIAITLGTGLGATFIANRQVITDDERVPAGGVLYNMPFKNGIAEDYVSTRGIIKHFAELTGLILQEVKDIAERASIKKEPAAIEVFATLAAHIAECLSPWIRSFNATCIVIGGSIAKSSDLFLPQLLQALHEREGLTVNIKISDQMEISAIAGAASLLQRTNSEPVLHPTTLWRKSSQPLLPALIDNVDKKKGEYDIYPYHSLGSGKVFSGYATLAAWMLEHKTVLIDGYGGNDWSAIRENLQMVFSDKQVNVAWFETSAFLKPEAEIELLVAPFLGEPNAVWGTKAQLGLKDLYNVERLEQLPVANGYDLVVLIGAGAGLCKWNGPVIYVDLPKNEIQYRMRAGSTANLGASTLQAPAEMYKRFYFVDWVVLNEHRNNIKNRITVVADGQWKDTINWALHTDIKDGLQALCKEPIRVRPWFEAGAWGGQWMKEHIPALNKEEINYAWSFELIVPENGLVFESDGKLLEVSFDWLMEEHYTDVLGKDADRFGTAFPIRFDFLDTYDGGNLSIQCHPSLNYIQKHFGERITQDETYYILDCKDDANVYLGFQEDIDPDGFKAALQQSFESNQPLEIEQFVQSHEANKHDLFLIPNGTVHSAGANNLVLEISATPYIFTFKMYDWVRPDLEGNPRPINIDHAFNNLVFERKGEKVKEELISKPYVLDDREGYKLLHYPTHAEHFYDVHRVDFSDKVTIQTNGQCHVLMLVEGQSINLKTANGTAYRFNYAETFVIPAGAIEYELQNEGDTQAKVIKAFIK